MTTESLTIHHDIDAEDLARHEDLLENADLLAFQGRELEDHLTAWGFSPLGLTSRDFTDACAAARRRDDSPALPLAEVVGRVVADTASVRRRLTEAARFAVWCAVYKPVRNELRPDAERGGYLFDKEHFDHVRRHSPYCVWTLVEDGDGLSRLVSGLGWNGVLGYVVATVPVVPGYRVECPLY